MRFQDKVAIVTGAGQGLGREFATFLAREGARVAVVDLNMESASKVAAEINDENTATAIAIETDVSSVKQINDMVAQVMSEFGTVDILVNNAGILDVISIDDTTEEVWDRQLDVNLKSQFFCVKAVAPEMRRKKQGKIINIASLLSFSGGITVPAYAASKGGVMQLTKALANEWANKGVQVNAIAPGYFATDVTEALRADASRSKELLARIPTGRWGEAEDLQGAVIYLASASSNYVTGHILVVDGGWMAR